LLKRKEKYLFIPVLIIDETLATIKTYELRLEINLQNVHFWCKLAPK